MNYCQYYKGIDQIDGETTRILCSYMAGGGKTFKNKDPEGAALIQCCWHKEKAEKECPLWDVETADTILDKPDAVPNDEDENVDMAEVEFNHGEQLQKLAEEFLKAEVICPYFKEAGKVEVNLGLGGLTFECTQCAMMFSEEEQASKWLSHCRNNPGGCMHYTKAKEEEKNSVEEYEPNEGCCQYFGGYRYDNHRVAGAMRLECSRMDYGGMTINLCVADSLKAVVTDHCKCGGKDCVFFMTDEEYKQYCERRERKEEEQQVFTTEVAANVDTRVSSERQDRAAKLTQRILANGSIAANSMIEMGRDLKTVRDERLFTELGFGSFEEYCEKKVGIGKRHGYNFIQVYEKFGEEKLQQLQSLGITKLLEIAKLDDEDAENLMRSTDVAGLSTRELSAEVEKYKNKYEQLTLLLDEEKSKNAESTSLESQVEELKKQLEAAHQANENMKSGAHDAEKHFEEQKAALLKEKEALSEQIKELESRPAEKAEIPEEERNALIQKGRQEMIKEKDKVWSAVVERREKAAVRNTEVKFKAEIEKLKAENAALQANAQSAAAVPAPAPVSGAREQIKFCLSQIQAAFNAAVDVLDRVNEAEQETLRNALNTALDRMKENINA